MRFELTATVPITFDVCALQALLKEVDDGSGSINIDRVISVVMDN